MLNDSLDIKVDFFCSWPQHHTLPSMLIGPYIFPIQTMYITFILSPGTQKLCPNFSTLWHCGGPLICRAFARFCDRTCLVLMCSPSAENKRRSKHAGKSLNPEWNQTVIYKNILLDQVCAVAVKCTLDLIMLNKKLFCDLASELLHNGSSNQFLFLLFGHFIMHSAKTGYGKVTSPYSPSLSLPLSLHV